MSFDNDTEKIINAMEKSGINTEKIKKATKNKDINSLLSSLSPQNAQKVKAILSSEEKTKQFLSSPQARLLIEAFLNGKKGG